MQKANERLREWMEHSGTSYATLAADLHIGVPHLSRLLNGVRRPSLNLAVRLATRTGIPVAAWVQQHKGAAA